MTVFPRARARARMHRPARETLRLAVFDSERARVRSSRLLRASEREREPQEREREREGVVSRYLSPKSVGNNTRRLLLLFLVCGRKKRRKKSQKRWTEGGLYYLRRKAKESSTFVHGHKNLPLFFLSPPKKSSTVEKKGWLCCWCW